MQQVTEEEARIDRELSIREVCQKLRKSRWYVAGLINDKGVLRARWEGNQYRIRQEDLTAYIESTYITVDRESGP